MKFDINRLTLFDHLQQDSILQMMQRILKGKNAKANYYDLIRKLVDQKKSFYDYVIHLMILGNNKKLLVYENTTSELGRFELACLHNDLEILQQLFSLDLEFICNEQQDRHHLLAKLEIEGSKTFLYEPFRSYFTTVNLKESEKGIEDFIELIRRFGVGPFAIYTGFSVREKETGMSLEGVERIDTLPWDEIFQYQMQKDALYKNTKALVEGKSFQNALLVGASGTGKSTSVKSVVNLFVDQKLRLIQIQKGQLHLLPYVLEFIKGRSFKFILFIDDLSFEANEDEYKFLKSFIEGSIKGENDRVAFYVTSNRRHLIKEIRTERENDIHLQDFIQEMTSLSDRFGLTLLYEGLNQNEYFAMVESMAMTEGIPMDKEELIRQARIYAMRHGKMSGRVANQFIKQIAVDSVH